MLEEKFGASNTNNDEDVEIFNDLTAAVKLQNEEDFNFDEAQLRTLIPDVGEPSEDAKFSEEMQESPRKQQKESTMTSHPRGFTSQSKAATNEGVQKLRGIIGQENIQTLSVTAT